MEQNLSPTGFGVEHTRHVGCGAKPDCDGVEDVLFAVVPKAISSIDNSLITGVLTSFVSSSIITDSATLSFTENISIFTYRFSSDLIVSIGAIGR